MPTNLTFALLTKILVLKGEIPGHTSAQVVQWKCIKNGTKSQKVNITFEIFRQ